MKILFFARHYTYLRLFEAPIISLAERGHQLHLVADRRESIGGRGMVERLAEQYPGITLGNTPGSGATAWSEFAQRLRYGIDYLRYLDPRYENTPHLIARARARAPRIVIRLAQVPPFRGAAGRALLGRMMRALERGLPVPQHFVEYRGEQAPDLVLIPPLVGLGSEQTDHLAVAKWLGLRTVLPVTSWDHL